MALATILLADDNTDFLKVRAELLRKAGYVVVTASNPAEAIKTLEARSIDVAVLDQRLKGGGDEDKSGLEIAKKVAPYVPKIILTAYPDHDSMREILSLTSEGLPYAIDYIDKKADIEELLHAIRRALALAGRFQQSIDGMSARLDRDYRDAQGQAKFNYWAALVVAICGVIIILVGAVLVLRGILESGIATAIAGIVAQAVGYLFFKRVDAANERMDRYHSEGIQIRSLEILLAACAELPANQQQVCKSMIIEKAASRWLGQPSLSEQVPSQSQDQKGQE